MKSQRFIQKKDIGRNLTDAIKRDLRLPFINQEKLSKYNINTLQKLPTLKKSMTKPSIYNRFPLQFNDNLNSERLLRNVVLSRKKQEADRYSIN